jgi:hypothetical protein
VVAALERLAAAGAIGYGEPTVPADVEERAQPAVSGMRDDDGDLPSRRSEERARLRQVARVADVLPRAAEDLLPLAAQGALVRIPAPRQRPLHASEL